MVERSHVAADVANVELGMGNVQLLVARRAITRDQAELVLAQCMEELTRLSTRLALRDVLIQRKLPPSLWLMSKATNTTATVAWQCRLGLEGPSAAING
jgi:hypothetical protein